MSTSFGHTSPFSWGFADGGLVSPRACAGALERSGARVTRVDAGATASAGRAEARRGVNALHGEWGETAACRGLEPGSAYSHCGCWLGPGDDKQAKAVMAAGSRAAGVFNASRRRDHVMRALCVKRTPGPRRVFLVFEGANSPPALISRLTRDR